MKIAFVSTRGIPNNYGGFEQFAEYISVGMAQRGHEVVVYSPKFHPYRKARTKVCGLSISTVRKHGWAVQSAVSSMTLHRYVML